MRRPPRSAHVSLSAAELPRSAVTTLYHGRSLPVCGKPLILSRRRLRLRVAARQCAGPRVRRGLACRREGEKEREREPAPPFTASHTQLRTGNAVGGGREGGKEEREGEQQPL